MQGSAAAGQEAGDRKGGHGCGDGRDNTGTDTILDAARKNFRRNVECRGPEIRAICGIVALLVIQSLRQVANKIYAVRLVFPADVETEPIVDDVVQDVADGAVGALAGFGITV